MIDFEKIKFKNLLKKMNYLKNLRLTTKIIIVALLFMISFTGVIGLYLLPTLTNALEQDAEIKIKSLTLNYTIPSSIYKEKILKSAFGMFNCIHSAVSKSVTGAVSSWNTGGV